MSLDKVRKYFERLEIEDSRIKEFESDSKVNNAAEVLGLDSARCVQTLGFIREGQPIVIVIAGDAKIDNSAYKHHFNAKAKAIKSDELHKFIGHEAGAECPFGLNENVKCFLDESLKRFDTLYISCGSVNSIIEMSVSELEQYCSDFAGWVNLCKDWK